MDEQHARLLVAAAFEWEIPGCGTAVHRSEMDPAPLAAPGAMPTIRPADVELPI